MVVNNVCENNTRTIGARQGGDTYEIQAFYDCAGGNYSYINTG